MEPEFLKERNLAFIIDMIAHLRQCLTGISGTYEDLIKRFLGSIEKGYRRIDIVADTYRAASIKEGERKERGYGKKVIIGSVKSKLPSDLKEFMLNADNKTNFINLTFDYIIENKLTVLKLLSAEEIYLSGDTKTVHLSKSKTEPDDNLTSDQEEADTKVILHALEILNTSTQGNIIVRNPSGDTDICVIMLCLIPEEDTYRVLYDYGSGNNRKREWLDQYAIDPSHKDALIGMHAFTGNDYLSSFFRKSKATFWKTMINDTSFLEFFSNVGNRLELDESMLATAEDYVCRLYAAPKKVRTVNEARLASFSKKFCNQNKIIDLGNLPPCQESLRLHLLRAVYVSSMWKRTPMAMINLPDCSNFGWDVYGNIDWIGDPFPEEIENILFEEERAYGEDSGSENEEDEFEYGSDVETDEELSEE